MSTPASLSGAAYSRTARSVSSPYGSSPSISGTRRRARNREESRRRRRARARARRSARRRPSPCVASRPILRLRVACTAACASGVITPITGTRKLFLKLRQRSGGRGVAGDDDQLHVLLLEVERRSRARTPHLGERTRPVRQARVVAEIDEVLVRHRHEALVQNGKPADARVEHADGPRVHGGDRRDRATLSPVLGRRVVLPRCRSSPRSRCGGSALAATAPQQLTFAASDGANARLLARRARRRATGGRLAGDDALPRARRQATRTWSRSRRSSSRPPAIASLECDARGHGASEGLFGLDGPRDVQDTRSSSPG